jgi:ATP-dependent Lon protease
MMLGFLSSKTENLKGINEMEEKVRKDLMNAPAPQKEGLPRMGGGQRKLDEMDKIRKRMEEKNLPVHVREEMEKEMETVDSPGSQNRTVTVKYLETLLDVPWN